MKGWAPDWVDCIDPPERQASFDVAEHLGIEWHLLDYSKVFFDKVFDPMLSGYFAGVTPNPDTLCNRAIKFGLFAEYALGQGAEFVASGHYVRKYDGELYVAKDKRKDQSYFLYDISRRIIQRALFPIGGYLKNTDVRRLAEKFGLPEYVRSKRSTVDICFLLKKRASDGRSTGERITMQELLEREGERRGVRFCPGPVVDRQGKEIGKHNGVMLYAATIGQRKRLGISAGKQVFVVAKDISRNTLVVDYIPPLADEFLVTNINWVARGNPHRSSECSIKVRTPQEPQKCFVAHVFLGLLRVRPVRPQTVAPGQACVFYQGEELLGGGTII